MSAVKESGAQTIEQKSVLRLTVNNHPGVMMHVCGLFARRAYNLEGIMVMPVQGTGGERSRMWLLVDEGERLEQIIRQTLKLVDVLDIERQVPGDSVFERAAAFFQA